MDRVRESGHETLVMDIFGLIHESLSAHRESLVNTIMHACEHYGMFQVTNHGISNDILTNAMTSASGFFNLPPPTYEECSKPLVEKRMLYMSTYAHHALKAEPPLYWRDVLQLPFYGQVAADGWPTQPPMFKSNVSDFASSVRSFENTILSLVSEGLGLSQNYFDEGLRGNSYILVNHYPRCPEPTQMLGSPKQCAPGLFTISLLGDVPGTQIFHDGQWICVAPSTDTLLVTVGHQLQVISNGRFKSPIHTEVVNSERDRTTISYVSEPFGEYVVRPAKAITETNAAQYKDFTYADYLEHHIRDFRNTSSILERYYMR